MTIGEYCTIRCHEGNNCLHGLFIYIHADMYLKNFVRHEKLKNISQSDSSLCKIYTIENSNNLNLHKISLQVDERIVLSFKPRARKFHFCWLFDVYYQTVVSLSLLTTSLWIWLICCFSKLNIHAQLVLFLLRNNTS